MVHLCRRLFREASPFSSPEMEKEFQVEHDLYVSRLCRFWCILNTILFLLLAIVRGRRFRWFDEPTLDLFLHMIPVLVTLSAFIAERFHRVLRLRVLTILSIACVTIVAWSCWSVTLMTQRDLQQSHSVSLPHVWAAIEANEEATVELQAFLMREETRKQCWFHLVLSVVVFNILHFIGFSLQTTLVYLLLPISYGILACTSLVTYSIIYDVFVTSIILTVSSILSSLQILILRRQQLCVTRKLRERLIKKSQAMQDLSERKAAHQQAVQQADSILCHMLKNMMADAQGCIQLYLQSFGAGIQIPPNLELALVSLDRGMAWCRKRLAMIKVASGQYTPNLVKVNLKEFGGDLMRGRTIAHQLLDLTVTLDPILCGIVLDNAINNAFRHGHPIHPEVSLSMQVLPISSSQNSNLAFEVTNRADPTKPVLDSDLVNQLLSGNCPAIQRDSLSDHIGLQHMFMAAKAHGMALTLKQDGDLVRLLAVIEVNMDDPYAALTTTSSSNQGNPFPPGLRILCLDDSLIAQQIMTSVLQSHIPGCTVRALGTSAMEVEQFMAEAPTQADIIIVDNHLEYESVSYLGTELLQKLISDGYNGFACVRSASMSPEDMATYFRSGAQCAIDKCLRPREMINALKSAYARHQAAKAELTILPVNAADIYTSATNDNSSSVDTHVLSPVSPFPPGVSMSMRALLPGATEDNFTSFF